MIKRDTGKKEVISRVLRAALACLLLTMPGLWEMSFSPSSVTESLCNHLYDHFCFLDFIFRTYTTRGLEKNQCWDAARSTFPMDSVMLCGRVQGVEKVFKIISWPSENIMINWEFGCFLKCNFYLITLH